MEVWCVGDAVYAATATMYAFTVTVYAKTVAVLRMFFFLEGGLFLFGRPWVKVFDPFMNGAFAVSHAFAVFFHPFVINNLLDLVARVLRP